MWRFFLKLDADGLLVRSAGMLQQLLDLGGTGAMVGAHRIPPLYGDFSLNAANVIAAKGLLDEGLSRLTPTHDLDAHQVPVGVLWA
jgi:putative protease